MKLIVTDMDGTLLDEKRSVSKENEEAIKAAQKQGAVVAIATGRDLYEATVPLKKTGLSLPIISANGAQIHDEHGRLLHEAVLSPDQARHAMAVLKNENVYFEVYTNEGVYSDDFEAGLAVVVDVLKSTGAKLSEQEIMTFAKDRFDNGSIKLIDCYEKLLEDGAVVLKLLAFSLDAERLMSARDRLELDKNFAVSASAADNLEITDVNAQKGIAVERLAQSLGISPKDVMAVGDNFNDVSMFQKAGLAVAMGNAPGEIQKQVDLVTKTNDEHGVAYAIRNYALKKQSLL
ncbi:Cof-type HAD-IIB family hydrolase [Shouchella clausii]|uniref:Cof-type HAD-IIB family hydrolase n=1 Tax=Shouchella clausii TaxID=79880 RepID=UPI00270D9917|nr:Cof-type HAD-IIB family hydrolase [Shouchella clausii]MDO7268162.1 Cof-type HAD-IIB family hydrolase [Shouchella clausii]MDO7288042.1 Cof-type HAD-IIB family hydrolase [Shouchella clausii]